MKKVVVMLALGLAIAGTSQAQDNPQRGQRAENRTEQGRGNREGRRDGARKEKLSPEQHATKRTEMLSQKYDLNNSQKKKLQALNLKHAQQLESFRGQYAQKGERTQRKEQHQQLKSLRADWDKELKDILTKKQYAKYQEDRKQMQANRANRRGKDGNRFDKSGDNGNRSRSQNRS
ncbi:DUF4890 domain-containing protein [Rufibacter hautae]|uniref:DUF4890 domain-containing protein n=1 Tax=Rufibacter hautae TaxID=2595005 RepID=A0A5B6TLI9_9BACT|nr:DUF4890 domain-containing protein [Rufibacter hautae]KAA3436962.1 DUF4890 domain-containing protein [Rufibacter hautae]